MQTNTSPQLLAQATGYTLLEPSVIQPNPASASGTPTNLTQYLKGAYVTLFIVIIIGAVLVLVYFGIAYMFSDVSNFKADAKRRLTNVFIGLAIALLSVVLLNEINPDLLSLDLTRIKSVTDAVGITGR